MMVKRAGGEETKEREQRSNDSLCIFVGVYWQQRWDDDVVSRRRFVNDWRCSRRSMLSWKCQLSLLSAAARRKLQRGHIMTFLPVLSLSLFLSRAHIYAFSLSLARTLIFTYIRVYLSFSLSRSVQTDDPPWTGRHFFDTAHYHIVVTNTTRNSHTRTYIRWNRGTHSPTRDVVAG